jgi:hypothetical protein
LKLINNARMIAVVVAVATVAAYCVLLFGLSGKAQETYQGPEFNLRRLTPVELKTLSHLASSGDCIAAYKVARHHMYYSLDDAQAIIFFRLASKCPNANAHASLISLLASKPAFDEEVDKILSELRTLDPLMGENASIEISHRRQARLKLMSSEGRPSTTVHGAAKQRPAPPMNLITIPLDGGGATVVGVGGTSGVTQP